MKRIIATLAVASALLVSGCGSDSPRTASPAASTTSAPAKPGRIVSLSPTATETLFAIGAGAQVVAVDDQSNFPANAPKTALSAYQPNAEAIAGYRPDLVVIAGDTKNLKAQLEKLAIPVLDSPAAKKLDDAYAEIVELGDRSGHRAEADALVATMRRRIGELAASAPKRAVPLTYFHELDNTLFSVTSSTFIGEVYKLAGLVNVADAADASGATGGYPQVTAEYLVKADPDLVFLADSKCCAQSAATFGARPGFGGLKAVKRGGVIALDDDVASRWGPRIVDLLARIIEAVKATAKP